MSYVGPIVRKGKGIATMVRNTMMEDLADKVGEAVSQLEDSISDVRKLENAIPAMISDHEHDASDTTSGTFDTDRLGTGTADSTTFLRGDGTWAVPIAGAVAKAALQTISSAGWVDVSDLSFPVVSGSWYRFHAFIPYMTSTTAMYVDFGMSGPAATTFFARLSKVISTASGTDKYSDRTVGSYDTSVLVTSEVAADPSVLFFEINGIVLPSADGTMSVRMDKENVAGTGTCLAGATLLYWKAS